MRAWAAMFNDFLDERGAAAAVHRRRLLRLRRRQAPLRRGAGLPGLPRHRAARGATDRRPCRGDRLRAGQPQERRLRPGPARRGRRGVPGVAGAAEAPARARDADGDRVVLPQRPGRAGGRRRGGTSSPSSCTAASPPSAGSPASPLPTPTRPPPTSSASPTTAASWSRTRSAASQAGAAGDFGLVIGVDRGAGARRAPVRPARTSSSPTSGSCCERALRTSPHATSSEDPLDRTRFPVDEWRLVETRFDGRGPRGHRVAVQRRQRLPRPARQLRGEPRLPHQRHLRQRLPRDLADPARRGGLRLRQGRADDRQRPRRQGHPALRRRRAAAALDRRPRSSTSGASTSAPAS